MASISVPCPKTVLVAAAGSNAQNSNQKQRISFPRTPDSNHNQSLSFGSTLSGFEWPNRKRSAVMKVQPQLNEVVAEKSSNSAPVVDTNSKVPSAEGKDESAESKCTDPSSIQAFMTQVSELVKLVDSRDITELQLKQSDCELIIRKKEALQQSAVAPAAPVFAMQPPYAHAFPAPPPTAPAAAAAPAPASPTPAPAPALPSPAKASSSSHPPLKCPMAGTFYRSPAPGEPPFVKVGDKVQKGQVVCIIEAMKLMNEIEADQSGTIAEVLAEDAKPVSVDTPLFLIVP